ncbi:MAG: hypothetical protein ACK40L_02665 [Hydrogenophaga sp.]|jgi:hypothetical protein|nr:hypothetical protein [Hydrogenophaga sp.]
MRTTSSSFITASFLLSLGTGTALAQHAISVPAEIEYNSNPALTPDGESAMLYRVAPQYTITRESGPTRSVLSFGGVLERSSDTRVSANRADPNISYELELSAPTSVITLNASLEEASSRTTEFLETGRVTEDSTLRTGLAGARWAKQLSESTSLELAGGYSQVRYDTPLLVGYSETRAESSLGWQPADGSRFSLAVAAARLNPDNNAERSRRQGLLVSHERQLSPTFSAQIGVGTVKTSGARAGRDTVGNLQLVYAGERLSSEIEWVREISPSGSVGGYTLSRGVAWGLSYPLTASTTLTSRYSRARSLEIDGSTGQSLAFGLRSELTAFWSMTVRLERARATLASGARANGNAIGIGLVYAHPNL